MTYKACKDNKGQKVSAIGNFCRLFFFLTSHVMIKKTMGTSKWSEKVQEICS